MAQNVLTPEHLKKLDEGIAAADEALAFCDQCERADIPMAEHKRKLTQQREQMRKIRSVFFPGQPPTVNNDQ